MEFPNEIIGQDVLYFTPTTDQKNSQEFKRYFEAFNTQLIQEMQLLEKITTNNSMEYFQGKINAACSWCQNFYSLLNLTGIQINENMGTSDMRNAINILNNYIYTTIFQTEKDPNVNKYILDFFQNWIIGYGKKNSRLRNTFTNLFQEIYKDTYDVLEKKIIEHLNSNDYSFVLKDSYEQIIYQYFSLKDIVKTDSNFSFNEKNISKKWREELSTLIENYSFDNIPAELQVQNKKGKMSFYLIKESIAKNKNHSDMYFQVKFTEETVDYLSEMIYNFVLKSLDEYLKSKKDQAITLAKWKIKEFLLDEQVTILLELKKGIQDYSLNKLKNKSDFTGFYGEVINACFLRVFYRNKKGIYEGNNVTQIGASKEFQKLKSGRIGPQPPSDIYIKSFSNTKNTQKTDIRVQVKQWGKEFRREKGLGEKYFSYFPYPKNLAYFYTREEDRANTIELFNIIRFLVANEEVYKNIGGKTLNLANPELYLHLIPGFLRIANFIDYINQSVNGNELFIVGGYYIPSFFILRQIQMELNDKMKDEKILSISKKITLDREGENNRRECFMNILSSHRGTGSKNILEDSLEQYRKVQKNSINNYKGEFGVKFKGVNVSQKALEGLI